MASLEQELIKLINEGYTVTKIMKMYGKEFEEKYQISEDHLFSVARDLIRRVESKLSSEEKQKLSEKRRLLSEKLALLEKAKVVALVKEFVCAELSNMPKDSILNSAITRAAKTSGLGKETVKKYMQEVDSAFYAEYTAEDVEYYIELAQTIIANNVPNVFAKSFPGYTSMMKYLEANRPDLLGLINENYARHAAAGKEHFRDTDKTPFGRI